ncbi:diacylglycerol kinase family protein [Halobacillus sp. H74]|uniref:diacylglycerol kinase family protein n=1 Tax=Halobacillus sp. H74 TaxID=3457436 RepID=UPI003FCCEF8D
MSSDYKDRKYKRMVGFSFALNGLKEVYKSERNFRIHLLITVFVLIAGFLLSISALEWIVVTLVISIILSLEMVNTGIEKLLDHLAPEHHPAIGTVKDITAGAVLVASIGSALIGIVIFLPKILSLF